MPIRMGLKYEPLTGAIFGVECLRWAKAQRNVMMNFPYRASIVAWPAPMSNGPYGAFNGSGTSDPVGVK